MTRTGRRAEVLAELLEHVGYRRRTNPRRPRLPDLERAKADCLVAIYRRLGGQVAEPVLTTGPWDLSFDGLLVELDEELHFNRYRAATLRVARRPWTDLYVGYCLDGGPRCRRAGLFGRRWTTPSAEPHFGPPDIPGVLDGAGSPRWKQRAILDTVKDHARRDDPVPMARVAIYDRVGDHTLEAILDDHRFDLAEAVCALVDARTA